jgi:DNA-binding MltR family transcriptional regulator
MRPFLTSLRLMFVCRSRSLLFWLRHKQQPYDPFPDGIPEIPPGKTLDEKLSPEEFEAFYDHSSDRAMAIVLGAIVENHLTEILKFVMRRDSRIAGELFSPIGPLGSFGVKIRLAYMLHLVEESMFRDLLVISKIRNRFAHHLSTTTFDDQQITDWVRSMHIYGIVKEMGEAAAERLRTKTSANDSERRRDFIKSNALLSTKDSYRDCIRYVIHTIVDFENSLKEQEAALNEAPSPSTETSPEIP